MYYKKFLILFFVLIINNPLITNKPSDNTSNQIQIKDLSTKEQIQSLENLKTYFDNLKKGSIDIKIGKIIEEILQTLITLHKEVDDFEMKEKFDLSNKRLNQITNTFCYNDLGKLFRINNWQTNSIVKNEKIIDESKDFFWQLNKVTDQIVVYEYNIFSKIMKFNGVESYHILTKLINEFVEKIADQKLRDSIQEFLIYIDCYKTKLHKIFTNQRISYTLKHLMRFIIKYYDCDYTEPNPAEQAIIDKVKRVKLNTLFEIQDDLLQCYVYGIDGSIKTVEEKNRIYQEAFKKLGIDGATIGNLKKQYATDKKNQIFFWGFLTLSGITVSYFYPFFEKKYIQFKEKQKQFQQINQSFT